MDERSSHGYANKENIPPPNTPIHSSRRPINTERQALSATPLSTRLNFNSVRQQLDSIQALRGVKRDDAAQQEPSFALEPPATPTRSNLSLGTKALVGSGNSPQKQYKDDPYHEDDQKFFERLNRKGTSSPQQNFSISHSSHSKGKDRAKSLSALKVSYKNIVPSHRQVETQDDDDDETWDEESTDDEEDHFISRDNLEDDGLFQPSSRLLKHFGLTGDSTIPRNVDTTRWLHNEEEKLYHQFCLTPMDMDLALNRVATDCYQSVRPAILKLLKSFEYKECAYAMFLSGYTYLSIRRNGHQSCCVFLMIDLEDTKALSIKIEEILDREKGGDLVDVIVHRGTPRLYGYENTDTTQLSPQSPLETTTKTKNSTPSNSVLRATPFFKVPISQTPSPQVDGSNILHTTVRTDSKYNYDAPGFHYGLHWITNLPVQPNETGVLTKLSKYPSIGHSISHTDDNHGTGTLGGYLVDKDGRRFIITAFHVFSQGLQLYKPQRKGAQDGGWIVSPGNGDFYAYRRKCIKKRDGLVHELLRAIHHQDKHGYKRIQDDSEKAIQKLDACKDIREAEQRHFGRIVASLWKSVRVGGTHHLADFTLVQPLDARIGSNTFDYHDRDKPYGNEYKLEARGWVDAAIGDEVLKLGRTTGLTKGRVISIDADLRVGIGNNEDELRLNRKISHEKPTNFFFEVQAQVATAGSSPWFSEPGDSGAFILQAPSIQDMKAHQWQSRSVHEPIAAPVAGLLFGGADSVEGVHLTFFNSSKFVQSQLRHLTRLDLTPGLYVNNGKDDMKHGLRAARRTWIADPVDDHNVIHDDEETPDDHPFRQKVAYDTMLSKIKWTERYLTQESRNRASRKNVATRSQNITPGSYRMRSPYPDTDEDLLVRRTRQVDVNSSDISKPYKQSQSKIPSKDTNKRFITQKSRTARTVSLRSNDKEDSDTNTR